MTTATTLAATRYQATYERECQTRDLHLIQGYLRQLGLPLALAGPCVAATIRARQVLPLGCKARNPDLLALVTIYRVAPFHGHVVFLPAGTRARAVEIAFLLKPDGNPRTWAAGVILIALRDTKVDSHIIPVCNITHFTGVSTSAQYRAYYVIRAQLDARNREGPA